jgi:hypothetical protein
VVAQFEAASSPGGDLGDDAFDVGAVAPVALTQFGVGLPVAAGLAEQVVAFV